MMAESKDARGQVIQDAKTLATRMGMAIEVVLLAEVVMELRTLRFLAKQTYDELESLRMDLAQASDD